MISAALQTTLMGIIPNTFIAIGDEEIAAPFCVHSERQSPVRLKRGVAGYEYECEIAVIDDSPDDVEAYKQSIRTAIEALEGTTASSTSIELVDYLGDDPGFDQESKLYINILRFIIQSSNI
jgi:hypothetical protein